MSIAREIPFRQNWTIDWRIELMSPGQMIHLYQQTGDERTVNDQPMAMDTGMSYKRIHLNRVTIDLVSTRYAIASSSVKTMTKLFWRDVGNISADAKIGWRHQRQQQQQQPLRPLSDPRLPQNRFQSRPRVRLRDSFRNRPRTLMTKFVPSTRTNWPRNVRAKSKKKLIATKRNCVANKRKKNSVWKRKNVAFTKVPLVQHHSNFH